MTLRLTRGRRLGAHLAAVALAGSSLALLASPAHAASPYDPSFTPVSSDLIAVGSDTTEIAMHAVAEDFSKNSTSFKVASFGALGATPDETITLPNATIKRPNGSGAGKATLYGSGNVPDVDFARASSSLNTTEVSAGLQQIPFAVDTLVMAVSNNVPSNAPTSLTKEQVVSIYKGDIKNWSEVGGKDGVIQPYIPQGGSGTRSFFEAQLKAANGGVAVQLASTVKESQEHDDTLIKGDPNAVAPFSLGRGKLLGNTLRYEDGTFRFQRGVYNVVRGGDQSLPQIQAFLGSAGFLCSTAAKSLIESGGLQQLATPDNGGVCGVPTQAATTNFTTNNAVATTTTLSVTSAKAGQATLTAAVTASNSPSGSVTFSEGGATVAANVPLTSGQAVATLNGVTPGSHTYTAVFTPDMPANFGASQDDATGVVKAGSALKATFPKKVAAGTKATGTVTVSAVGASAVPTGTVTVKVGSKKVSTATLSGGKAKVKLGKVTKKTVFTVVYSGDSTVAGSSTKATVKTK